MQIRAKSVGWDTLKLVGSPVRSRTKSGGKGSVASLKELIKLGCVSHDTEPPKKSFLWKSVKIGSNRAVTFSKSTWHHIRKNRERKGPSKGKLSEVWTSRTQSVRTKIWGWDTSGNLATRTIRPQRSMGLGETGLSTQNNGQGHVLLSYRSMGNASTLFEKAREARIRGRFRSTDARAE